MVFTPRAQAYQNGRGLSFDEITSNRALDRYEQHNPRLPFSNGAAPRRNVREEKFRDAIEYQFWPSRIAMGTTIGRQFVQVKEAQKVYG